jgi:uncharacterized damage-inducible protein DinB
MSTATDDLRYPIGRAKLEKRLSDADRVTAIDDVAVAPRNLRNAVAGLTDEQLDTPYREGGWTVRQLTHHVADSHINAYTRFRLALTEDNPTVKTYDESEWAKLEDSRTMPAKVSLDLLELLHERWVVLLRSMQSEDFQRTIQHPENGPMTLDALLCMYQWHGKHHTAHVTALRERMNWA